MKDLTRRRFLQSALGGATVILLAACGAKSGGSGGIDGLANGEGAILDLDGETVAVYKDANGSVIKLSPICPHAGCEVAWNATGKTWDCPCHASVFGPDGARISGPAPGDLEKIS
jgi:nitrite reductase/ring-hydroxylating ferredoxin subunit